MTDKHCLLGYVDQNENLDGTITERHVPGCTKSVVYRWRTAEFKDGDHWNYRCNEHVMLLQLDLPGMKIEAI